MEKYTKEFELFSKNLSVFIDTVKSKRLTLQATDEWTVKDVLCHIVFWHEIYAANYSAQVNNLPFDLPDNMSTINRRGVASLQRFTRRQLLERLQRAHESLKLSILEHQIPSMIYSKGGRIYKTDEFLIMIGQHFVTHTKHVRRAH